MDKREFEQFYDSATGKIELTRERQADILRALVPSAAADEATREELKRVAREINAQAADPSRPSPIIRRMVLR